MKCEDEEVADAQSIVSGDPSRPEVESVSFEKRSNSWFFSDLMR